MGERRQLRSGQRPSQFSRGKLQTIGADKDFGGTIVRLAERNRGFAPKLLFPTLRRESPDARGEPEAARIARASSRSSLLPQSPPQNGIHQSTGAPREIDRLIHDGMAGDRM